MSIEVRTVFCDDIRREDNGKAILIGVYTGDLIPNQLPGSFPISIWLDIRGLKTGAHEVKINLDFPLEAKLSVPGKIDVDDPSQPVTMMISGLPANVTSAGTITATIEIDGRRIPAGSLIVRSPLKA